MKKLLVLASMATAVAVMVAGLAGVFGTGDAPTVYASRLAGIQGAGISGIQIQNLDASQPATIVADFYNQRGGGPVTIQRPGVGAGAAANIYLPAENTLSNGAYAAIISADRQIAAIARTDWGTSGAAAIYSNVQPGTDVSLPLAVKGYFSQTSLVSIQNTDTSAQATVNVALYAAGSTDPVQESTFSIAPGTSTTLDLGKNGEFAALPDGYIGSMSISSDSIPVGVQSFIDLENQDKAVYAFEGVPSEQAADALFVPLIRNNFFGTTGISVVNPGSTDVMVEVTYIASPLTPACTDTYVHGGGPQSIAAGSSLVFYQGGATDAGEPGLPSGCLGSATVTATGGNILAIVNDADLSAGTSAAYNAVSAAQGASKVALPLFRNAHTKDQLSTGIQAMNIGDEVANVVITFSDSSGTEITGCGADCQVDIASNGSHTWYPPAVQGIKDRTNTFGSATIESTNGMKLAVIVNDATPLGTLDSAIYNGIKAD